MARTKKLHLAVCVWTPDEDGTYQTDCGHAFQFNNGGPKENHQQYCGYCGRRLKAQVSEGDR